MNRTIIELMDNMHLSSQDLFLEFYKAMQNNDVNSAQRILDNNPDLANQITNSENINYLINILNARELEPKTDIDIFLDNLYQLFLKMINDTRIIGNYSSTVQYNAHNFVFYQNKYYYAIKTPPIGTVPTNTEYWNEYDIKGFQGYGGVTNLNYLGNWDSTINYKPYDVVVYQNKVWYAIDNNINYVPNLNHYPWNPIMFPAQAVKTPIQKEQPLTGYSEGDFWFQITQGNDIVNSSWETLRPEPLARWAASSFMINDLIYIVGGTFGNFSISNDVEAYDTLTNTWSIKASYPLKVAAMCSFALNGVGYCVGGENSVDYVPTLIEKSVYSYNPTTNAWTKKNDFIAPIAGVNTGTVANGKGCVIGDYHTHIETQGKIYLYDDTNDSWSLETESPAFLVGKIVASVDDKIYIMGGTNALSEPTNKNYIYNMTTKTWTQGRDLPSARVYGSVFTNSGNIYIVGGMDKLLYSTNLVERYNIATNEWKEETPMSYARNSLCSENSDKYGYSIGGINLMQPLVAGYVERYAFNPEYSNFDMIIDTSLGTNSVSIPMVSTGTYNYYIDWGDGTNSAQITNYADQNATHTYTTSGEYTIKLHGDLNQLKFKDTNIGKCLTEIQKCNLSFADITEMFMNCVNLTYVPDNIFYNSLNITTAKDVFNGCSKLNVIPGDLFTNNPQITTFNGAFENSGVVSIPTNLFDSNSKVVDFANTFSGCGKLTVIPRNLFFYNTDVTTFNNTFDGCTSLISLPNMLFSNNNSALEFDSTFLGCTNLTDIPGDLFNNANGSVISYNSTFKNTNISELPTGLFRYANSNVDYTSVLEKSVSGLNDIIKIPDNFFNGDNADWTNAFDISKITSLGSNSLNGLNITSDMFKDQKNLIIIGEDAFWAKGTQTLTNNPTELLNGCSNLAVLGNVDFSVVPSNIDLNSIFSGCSSLSLISGFKTLNNEPSLSHNISFSDCILSHDSLVNLTDSLKTLTQSKTLTLGDYNLSILSDTEKLIIINKNWILAGWNINFSETTATNLVQEMYGNDTTTAKLSDTTDLYYTIGLYNANNNEVINWYVVNRQTGKVSLYDDVLNNILDNAQKTLSPAGFAGAFNDIYVLEKNNDLYYYTQYEKPIAYLAKGVLDITRTEDNPGVVIAKRGTGFEIMQANYPDTLEYE